MAFNIPINTIAPISTPDDWVRPSDWITITDTPNEVQFLVADTGSKAFAIQTTFIKNSGTNIYIDWGDGVVDTISTIASTTTNHVYSSGGTPCSRGYNTFKIRIYGDATCQITNAKHFPNFSITGGAPYYNIGLLEAYFGDGSCNTSALTTNYFSSFGTSPLLSTFEYLEYVKLPSTVTWTTQMSSMFTSCYNLYKVVMPTSATSLSMVNNIFNNCSSLTDIIFPSDATSITTFDGAFTFCTNLRTVSFPTSLDLVTTFASAFVSCYSIKNLTIPSINSLVSFNGCFNSCRALQWVKFNSLPSPVSAGTVVDFGNIFNSCFSLQNVYMPVSCSANAVYNCTSMFLSCSNLKNFLFPINFNASTVNQSFQGCDSLTSVVFQSNCPSLTSFTSTFSSCYLLNYVKLPDVISSSVSLNSTFASCYSLSDITIPSGWTINSLSATFNNCSSLKTIVLPNNAQNSCTTMSGMCSNCNALTYIVMPTSLSSLNSLSGTFSGCNILSSVVFPASMPALTTMASTFTNCRYLINATLPTSAPVLTDFSFAFSNCISIREIVLPSTISASLTTFSTMTNGCISLKTITLPTTQTSTCTSIVSMFNRCGSLTSIINLDKIGSLTATPLVNGSTFLNNANQLTSLSFNCPFSALVVNGASSINFNKLNSLRLLNTGAGQWTGTSPQINVSYCDLGVTALNQLFTDLTTITAKTINITGCTGAAGCTRSIATAKGWTVTG